MIIEQLKNACEGKDCVILTCGPSLREFSKEKVKNFCKGKLVICIKEAVFEYEDIANIFVCNNHRLINYSLNNDKIIKILQWCGRTNGNKFHIILKEDRPFSESTQLLQTKEFDKYDFNNKTERPWGPGIIYETVLYLAKYMGCKNVYTIGWDLIDTNKQSVLDHFFDEDSRYKDTSIVWENTMNPEKNRNKEMVFVANNIIHMYEYFKNNGMNIFVVGEMSHLDRRIPRIMI